MLANLTAFLIQLGITAASLWVASLLFNGIRFASPASLIVSALLLGLANAVLWPLLVLLTLPLTILTLGLFLLVINALLLWLVARMVPGFTVSGFRTALFASLFVSMFSLFLNALMPDTEMAIYRLPSSGHTISM